MKKSELKNLIKQLLKEQGPDPVEPNTGPTMFPGGIATGPAMGKPMGGGNMATPDKGIENPRANACCGPLKSAIDTHKNNVLSHSELNSMAYSAAADGNLVPNEILLTAKIAKTLHDEMQIMFDKCCQGRVDTNVTITTPTTSVGDKFTGGGGNMIAPVKGIQPAQDAIISERLQKLANIK